MEAYDLISQGPAVGSDTDTPVVWLADDPTWLTPSVRYDLVQRCRAAIADELYETEDRYDLAVSRLASLLR